MGIDLKGREWKSPEGETKYFNSIQGWRIDADKDEKPAPEPPKKEEEEDDDLPF